MLQETICNGMDCMYNCRQKKMVLLSAFQARTSQMGYIGLKRKYLENDI